MSQHDYVIANGTGAAVRSDLNNALAAIVTQNSGATAPATTYAYQWWADTTTGLLKLRNAANNAWITLFQLDGEWSTLAVENGSAAAPSIYFKDSGTDTGIYSPGTDQVAISTNGTGRLFIDSSGNVTINGQGDLRLADSDSSNWVAFQAPATVASNVTWTLPSSDGSASQVLSTDGAGTLSWASVSSDKISEGNTEAEVVDTGSDGHFKVTTEGSERLRVDPSGRLLIGTSTALGTSWGGAGSFQISSNSFSVSQVFSYTSAGGDGYGSYFELNRARGTQASPTVVSSGDELGEINFSGHDGAGFIRGATIKALVDGTPGTNDMPGRLVFSVTSDGSASPVERGRLINSGYWKFSNSGNYNDSQGATASHFFQHDASNSSVKIATAWNNSYASIVQSNSCLRAANSAYSFFKGVSGNGSTSFADNEFDLRGDGTGLCDGSWTGGGADYAEYFEWADNNPDAEDRRGISVVLDGDKIREAVAGEDPIGVISGNPSVVGDAAWNKWSGKYLRDDFGTYIQEDYEVEDEDGNTVVQQRRKLNPAYDPDVEYISREQRPEWDCVGLMGKLRIRKGQITGSRWIKMRDISDSVEEWLVR